MNLSAFILFFGLCGVLGQSSEETTTEGPADTTKSTTTTTTTSTPKPTTTPTPKSDKFYRIKNGNLTCIMLDGGFTVVVPYNTSGDAKNKTHVSIPKPSKDVAVSGSCEKQNQFIKMSWGDAIPQSSFHMQFNRSTDGKMWTIKSLEIYTNLDSHNFANASDQGKTLISQVYLEMSPVSIAVNHSYKCYTRAVSGNISTSMDGVDYKYPIILEMDGVQIEAFNGIPDESDFVDGIHCSQDEVADIVPIAVGCALAILVVIVLVAYLVGRKRRAAAYQSV